MRWSPLLLAAMLMGAITYTTAEMVAVADPDMAEVRFGALAPDSTVGTNATNGSASIAGSLVLTTASVLYLNNTNASGAYFAKLVLWSSGGLTDLTNLIVGIDNGTKTPQILGALGVITQSSGAYVRLEPSSTNMIYVTQLVGVSHGTTTLDYEVRVADTAAENAFYTIRARTTLT